MKIDNKQIELNSEELLKILDFTVKQNRILQSRGMKPKSLNIQGKHGYGKTTSIRDYAKNNNLQFIEINLSSMEETGDLIGMPITEFYMCKDKDEKSFKEINGVQVPVINTRKECVWVTDKFSHMYEEMGYKHSGRARMAYATPHWLEGVQENGILLLDDFSRRIRF